MSPSGIGKILSGIFGATPVGVTSGSRIPDGTPQRIRPAERENSDAVVLNVRSQPMTQEEDGDRSARVQRLKRAVSQGMYRVDSEAVAAALVRDLG